MIDLQLLLGLILTVMPLIELRGGLPVVIDYCLRNSIPIMPYFFIVLILNIVLILFIFLFLDIFHVLFMRVPVYKKTFGATLQRIQKKVERVKEKKGIFRFVILMLFVSVPLPGTGAWTGSLIAWTLNLNRLKSFIAISLGVIIAGILILFASLGFLGFFY